MTTRYAELESRWRREPRRFLVTGAAGFIGSHLIEKLLQLGQQVVALDSFATGKRENLEEVRAGVDDSGLIFVEADIVDPEACRSACEGVDAVLHQAALGSVPRSIENPQATHAANVDGFVNMLEAARTQGVRRFVYASSSSVYGDHPDLPKREASIGRPLSPYAASKRIDEIYAQAYENAYGLELVGLRYFNVFGPRQDPDGPYAAVIPRWLAALVEGRVPLIFGDGETSRDFCPVWNAVQANLLAAGVQSSACGRVYNVALGGRTTLLELFTRLRDSLARSGVANLPTEPEFAEFRLGDVRHSLADISAAAEALGYAPEVSFAEGIERTVTWALERLS